MTKEKCNAMAKALIAASKELRPYNLGYGTHIRFSAEWLGCPFHLKCYEGDNTKEFFYDIHIGEHFLENYHRSVRLNELNTEIILTRFLINGYGLERIDNLVP